MKAIAAMKAGEFADEITPVEVAERSVDLESAEVAVKTRTVNLDEGARPDTTVEGLAKLKTVFAARGSVTAGNSSQTSDGAGALILASEAAVKRFGLKPLARFVSYASRGVPPHIMGIGPIEAIPAALRYAGLKQEDMDWIELNEAFAAQSLAVINTLGPGCGQGQPDGRRHRAGPSAGRHRRYPVGDSGARAAAQESEVRHGHDVRGHGAGRGGDLRAGVTQLSPSLRGRDDMKAETIAADG